MFKDTKLFVTIPWFGTFEEINLRFMWFEKREIQSNAALSLSMKRFRIPAWMANKLYNEITLWCLQNTKLVRNKKSKF
jgi:hypothetical protein